MDRQKVDKIEIELIKELSKYITFYENPKKQIYDEDIIADFATLQIEGVAMLLNRLSTFNIALLADEVGISRVQLHRKLKDLIGVSTSEFIRNLRLQQATILLKDNKVNISQIAYAVGFSNPILFSSTFKKTYGCTPREYRERNM